MPIYRPRSDPRDDKRAVCRVDAVRAALDECETAGGDRLVRTLPAHLERRNAVEVTVNNERGYLHLRNIAAKVCTQTLHYREHTRVAVR